MDMLKTFTLALCHEVMADMNRKLDKYTDRIRDLERENSDLKTRLAIFEAVGISRAARQDSAAADKGGA